MRLDTLLGQRLEGTCEWIFEEQSFRAWIDSPPSSTFWIQGGPGTGKSVLTSAIIERLRKNRCPTIFFHFDQGDSALSDPKLFLDSLIAQMLQFDRRLSEGHGIFQGQAYTPISKSFAKFSELALKFEELYCCVDAIEECGTSVELLLYLISDMARSMAYPVKFLVSSRSTPESLRCMENFSSIVRLPTDGTRKDVQQLAAFQLKKTKSPDDVYRQFEIDRLTSAANGMFLWLNLVLKGAEVSGTVSDPYKRSLPEVYRDSVLSLTRSQTLSENELLCTILYWTTTALRPLKVNELQIALAVTPGDTSLEELKILSAPHQAIQKIGGHLIEIESNNSVVQVHQSLISFLKTADCPCILVSPEISIPIKPERSHAYLGAVCITYLSFGCFQDPYKPHTQDIHTFLYYAASFWHLHTIRAGKNKVLAQRVLAFLGSDQGFNWLDALMTIFGKSVEDLLLIQFQISAWLRQFDEDIGSEGGDFVLEAYRIRTARFGKTDSLTNQETTMLQNFADLCQAKGLFHESERLYHRVLGTNEDSNIAVRLPKGRDKSFANTETEHSATPPNLGGSPSSLSLDKESNNSPSVNMKTSHGSLTEGGSDDLRTKSSLALTYRNQGRWKEAEELEFQVTGTRKRELGKEHPLTLMSMDNLASTYHIQGRWKEAEELEVQVLETRTRIFGDEHPDTLTSMGNLALTYHSQGRWKEAEELEVQVLETRTRIFGDEHPDTLTSMGNLASTYHRQGRWDEAEELEVQVMRMRTRVLGKQHPDTLASMNNLALALSGQGKYPEAEKMYQETLALQEIVLGKEHPNTLTSMNNLAQALSGQGKYLEAEKMHRETLALGEKVLGKEHPGTLTSMNNLADALSQQGKYAEAEKMYNETLALQEMILGIEHPDTLESISNLAQALSGQGKYAEAEKMHHETLALQKMILGKEHPSTLTSMSNLARVLSAQGKYTEAISAMQQCFQLQTKILGSHHPHTKASRTALDKWQIRP
jgi:tetratricopeptide (TPR) repeat protein